MEAEIGFEMLCIIMSVIGVGLIFRKLFYYLSGHGVQRKRENALAIKELVLENRKRLVGDFYVAIHQQSEYNRICGGPPEFVEFYRASFNVSEEINFTKKLAGEKLDDAIFKQPDGLKVYIASISRLDIIVPTTEGFYEFIDSLSQIDPSFAVQALEAFL